MVSPGAHSGDDTSDTWAHTRADTPESWPVTTWQGWQNFTDAPPPTPPEPGTPPRGRAERLAYHWAFVTVRTPTIDTLAANVRTLMILGRHQRTTARPSLIAGGPAAAGKTTALHPRRARLPPRPPHPPRPGATRAGPHPCARRVRPRPSGRDRQGPGLRVRPLPRRPRHGPDDTGPDHRSRLPHLQPGRRPPGPHRRDPAALNPRTTTGAETADLSKRPHRTHRRDIRVRGHRRDRHPVVRGCTRSATRRTRLVGRVRGLPRPARETRTVQRIDRRNGSRPRPARTPRGDTTAASRPISTNAPPAGSAASPASSAKPRSPRSWTAPNASPEPASTRFASTTSPKHTNAPTPPAGPAHPGGRPPSPPKTLRAGTNTVRALRRTGYVKHTRKFSTKPPHPQAKPPAALTRTATNRSHPTCNTPTHTTTHTPTNHPPGSPRLRNLGRVNFQTYPGEIPFYEADKISSTCHCTQVGRFPAESRNCLRA